MKLPDQSPPVQRGTDQARATLSRDSRAGTSQFSCLEPASGIVAAGYEQCYSLPDPALTMCLLAYGSG